MAPAEPPGGSLGNSGFLGLIPVIRVRGGSARERTTLSQRAGSADNLVVLFTDADRRVTCPRAGASAQERASRSASTKVSDRLGEWTKSHGSPYEDSARARTRV